MGLMIQAGPLVILRNLAFYVAFYGGTVINVLAALAALPFGRRIFRRVIEVWCRYHRFCMRYLLGLRVEVQGDLPSRGVLVALKHESFFEAIDLPAVLDYPVVFAKAELLRIPLWGLAGRRYGLVPVERSQGAKTLRSMIAAARELAADGRPLAIFPEGTRIPHGTIAPMQSGFAGLYRLLGLPVVPVAVNSGPRYHRRWKLPGTITYIVGEQIPAGLPREEIEARVTEAINLLNSVEE